MTNSQIKAYAENYRGSIIHALIRLERIIDIYIASYFTKDGVKQMEMILLIFGNERITFGSKQQILAALCSSGRIDLAKDFPTMIKDLADLTKHRNIFAHYLVTPSKVDDSQEDGTIIFMKLKNTSTKLIYKKEKITEILEKIDKIHNHFVNKVKENETDY